MQLSSSWAPIASGEFVWDYFGSRTLFRPSNPIDLTTLRQQRLGRRTGISTKTYCRALAAVASSVPAARNRMSQVDDTRRALTHATPRRPDRSHGIERCAWLVYPAMAEALPRTPFALRTRHTPAQAPLSKANSLLALYRTQPCRVARSADRTAL